MYWNKYEDRKINILNILENKFVDLKWLENNFNVSNKTLRNDVNYLNDKLIDSAYINIEDGVVKLFIYNYALFIEEKNNIIEKSMKLSNEDIRIMKLFDILLDMNYFRIDDIAEKLYISRSSVVSDIEKLKVILKNYKLDIEGKQNTGIRLSGDEVNIRKFILDNEYSYANLDDQFNSRFYEKLHAMLGFYGIYGHNYEKIKKFINVSIYRYKKGFTINKLNKENNQNFNNEVLNNLKNEINCLIVKEKEYLSETEIQFIMTPLLGMRTPLKRKKISGIDIPFTINNLVDEIFLNIRKKMDLDVNLGEVLEDFTYHIYFLVNRINLNYEINNPIKNDIKTRYKVAYEMARISSKVIEEKTDKYISESELAYLASYFQLYVGEILDKSKVNKYKIALINGYAISETLILKRMIEDKYNNEFSVEIFDDIRNVLDIKQYDLLISNRNIETNQYFIYEKDLTNFDSIKRKIDKYKISVSSEININNSLNSIIVNKLNKENFFLLNGKNYNEDLNTMLNKLSELGIADENFKDRILKREKVSSTIFSNEVAFPHTSSNELIISLGINHKTQPNLIFLVGVDSSKESTLIRLYDEIASISTNKNIINEVKNIKSYSDFVETIITKTRLFR